MSKINRLPKGLQEFLGNTAAGQNPDTLLNDVRPVIDLTPHWSFEETKWISATGAVALPNQGSFFVVPDGELWAPIHIGARINNFPAGANVVYSVRLLRASASEQVVLNASGVRTNVNAGDVSSWGYSFPQRTFYGAGAILSIVVDRISDAATMNGAMEYVRLRA